MNHLKIRKAFTMIELLFVIVILAIIGVVALETIRNYYEGIYRTKEYTERVTQADHILEQAAKYFESAISLSIVNLDRGAAQGCYGPPSQGDANDYTVAFVGVDEDSLRGLWNGSTYIPGWNEDVSVAGTTMTMSGGDYNVSNTVINALFPASNLANSAIYNDSVTVGNRGTCDDFNWSLTSPQTKFLPIIASTGTTITSSSILGSDNVQRAYLLSSAYAFRVLDNGDFMMYSNFRPWLGERYNTALNRRESLLGRNVAHFYADYDARDFMNNPGLNERGMVWRLKVCMRGIDQNLSDSSVGATDICREKRVHVRY